MARFSLKGFNTYAGAGGAQQLNVQFTREDGRLDAFTFGSTAGQFQDQYISGYGATYYGSGNFSETDLNSIYSAAAYAGFTGFDQYKGEVNPLTGLQTPTVNPTAPIEPTPTTPSAPTANPSITGQNSSGNGISPAPTQSGNSFAGNQAVGWASFASQVQGTALFNQVQQNIQQLLGGTGNGTGGEVVANLIANIQSGQTNSIGGGQAADRYTKSNRKKIGYEELKTFDKASQAATLGKPTLLGD